MNRDIETIAQQAAAWHIASLDDAMDWDGFTRWLEADARHREVYDQIALADALAAEHGKAPVMVPGAANDAEPAIVPARGLWLRWAGVGIAASLLAVIAAPQFMAPAPQVYLTQGAARAVALDDGSRIVLAPRSRLEVSGRRQDRLALSGGAWFEILHDPSRRMEIAAGDITIKDIGTSFDVQASKDHVRVEVAEGRVAITSQRLAARIPVAAGRAFAFDGVQGTSFVVPLDLSDAGEWRHGQLTYDSAPLALVAEDLGRYAGVRVTVPPGIGNRQFSGTLTAGNGEAALRDLSQLMGLELRSGGGGAYSLSE